MTRPSDSTSSPGVVDAERPLTGFRIGITAARRADELATLLTRRGAEVLHAPAIRLVPLADDVELEARTREIVAEPPDLTVATTGIGFRGWVEAAEGWGIADELLAALGSGRVIARGPKATGALRAAGLREEWSPDSESSAEVLSHLLADGVAGLRIAVQLHGATTEWEPLPDFCDGLRAAGATVVPVPVYRWVPPDDPAPMDRLIEAAVCGELDAVTFTSAPAVASMMMRAADTDLVAPLQHAFRTRVVPVCVGPVTAGPFDAMGIATTAPARARVGALVRHVADELPARVPTAICAGHAVRLLATTVLVDGAPRTVPRAALAVLDALARRPGAVVSREDLLAALPGGGDDTHAVETAVARLRSALGVSGIVATVVKRGYRLNVDHPVGDGVGVGLDRAADHEERVP